MAGVEIIADAELLNAQGRSGEAIELYIQWINENPESPLAYAICFNLGVLLANSGQGIAGEAAYRRSIELNPDCLAAHFNLGTQLEASGKVDEAVAQWKSLLDSGKLHLPEEINFYRMTCNNLGRLLEIQKHYVSAEQYLVQSLQADPNQKSVIQHFVHLRQKQCEWPILSPEANITLDEMLSATGPLSMLAAVDSPEFQRRCADNFVRESVLPLTQPLADRRPYGHGKLRVAYLSGDFCSHPVAMLTVELFELHNRNEFEVFGFCWSRIENTPFQHRVWQAFDHHVRIDHLTDEAAAQLIREHEIDILIDLQGLTLGSRPNILSYRPAPVQVTYLGFPGTTGMPSIDYVLADKFVLPESEVRHFSETPIYLETGFQVIDTKRESGIPNTRDAYGLPVEGVVFCCFNNTFKFTPEIFDCWMRILLQVPGSVMWLLAENPAARQNLKQRATLHGVESKRLIFAKRVAPADYLARYRVADLFLDTYPFGAGTTASDAIAQTLPLLTMPGRTFASRMAASLLNTLGVPELIANSLEEYEKTAVALGNDHLRLILLRQYLYSRTQHSQLFDMPARVREIEQIYARLSLPQDPPNDHEVSSHPGP